MALNKATGNMYTWVSHTWNPIAGECPHRCEYCYVGDLKTKPVLAEKYSGEPRLQESEMGTSLGTGNVIFVQNMGDLFAEGVPHSAIMSVLEHIQEYNDNRYLLQTKNPGRMLEYSLDLPPDVIIGTTVESDCTPESNAPHWIQRLAGLSAVRTAYKMHHAIENPHAKIETMVSIEPVTRISNIQLLMSCLVSVNPNFISIGADSKNTGLDEPEPFMVYILAHELSTFGVKIFLKPNLKRIIGDRMWNVLLTDKNTSEV